MQTILSPEDYIKGILQKDRIILSKAITLIESTKKEDEAIAETVLQACLKTKNTSKRIAITGSPGAGKSTFINAFGKLLLENKKSLAVLAIDPSSTISKGSILGDKTRMEDLVSNEHCFIRPTASNNHLGGVGRTTRETILLCEAFGFDYIFVETVGVGQSETLVKNMTDLFMLLLLPNSGDELQGIKRGIMESADLIVVTKCDGANAERANAAFLDLQHAVQLLPPRAHGGRAEVLACSALMGEGLDTLLDRIAQLHERFQANGHLASRRAAQEGGWRPRTVEEGLLQAGRTHPKVIGALPALGAEVEAGRISPFKAARQLLELFRTAS